MPQQTNSITASFKEWLLFHWFQGIVELLHSKVTRYFPLSILLIENHWFNKGQPPSSKSLTRHGLIFPSGLILHCYLCRRKSLYLYRALISSSSFIPSTRNAPCYCLWWHATIEMTSYILQVIEYDWITTWQPTVDLRKTYWSQ